MNYSFLACIFKKFYKLCILYYIIACVKGTKKLFDTFFLQKAGILFDMWTFGHLLYHSKQAGGFYKRPHFKLTLYGQKNVFLIFSNKCKTHQKFKYQLYEHSASSNLDSIGNPIIICIVKNFFKSLLIQCSMIVSLRSIMNSYKCLKKPCAF